MRIAALWTLGLIASWMLVGCDDGGGIHPSDAGLDGSEDAGATSLDADSGSPDAGSPDAAACGGLAWTTPSCASCTHEACCSVEVLCAAIPACSPLDACWNACGGDAACNTGCGTKYETAISNYNAILNCQFNSCATTCVTSE